jgi:hypothetical protein
MADISCKYCTNTWKLKRDYEKHLACCEFFFNMRRNPHSEMDDYGTKLPSNKELFRFVQELSLKCERLEREVTRLKATVSVRQKKVIVECLNNTVFIPQNSFCEWWKTISLQMHIALNEKEEQSMSSHWSTIRNPFLFRVFNIGLVDGIKMALGCFINTEKANKRVFPIRCFTQKPNAFYIYSSGDGSETGSSQISFSKKTKNRGSEWKLMTNADMETMVDYISQLFVREFLQWQKNNVSEIGGDERRGEEQITYMMRVNAMRPNKEKGIAELRKWLFSTLEESTQSMAECEYV